MGSNEVSRMASGQHTSVRVALAVPPRLHEQLKGWAEYEGRPIASLCMYLIENSLRQAQKDGIAPSFKQEQEGESPTIDRWKMETEFRGSRFVSSAEPHEEKKRFTQFYEDKLAEAKLRGDVEEVAKTKEEKQAKLLALLAELQQG